MKRAVEAKPADDKNNLIAIHKNQKRMKNECVSIKLSFENTLMTDLG